MSEKDEQAKVELGGIATRQGMGDAPDETQIQIQLYRENGQFLRTLNVPKECHTRFWEFSGRRYERQGDEKSIQYLEVGEAVGVNESKLTYDGRQKNPFVGFGE